MVPILSRQIKKDYFTGNPIVDDTYQRYSSTNKNRTGDTKPKFLLEISNQHKTKKLPFKKTYCFLVWGSGEDYLPIKSSSLYFGSGHSSLSTSSSNLSTW